MRVKSIALHQLEPVTDASTFSYPVGAGALTDSIRDVGLLQPIAVPESGPPFRVVFGAKRIAAALELGWTDIPARLYAGMSGEEVLFARLHQDCFQRHYNPIEKAKVLRAFLEETKYTVAQLCDEIAPKIGVPPTPEWVRKYLSLLEFDEQVKLDLACGQLNPVQAFILLPFKPPDRTLIFEKVIKNCQPSVGDCREILDNLFDVSAISGQSVLAILTGDKLGRILDSKAMKPTDRCNKIRSELRTLRFPYLSKMDADFRKARAELVIDNDIRITPPRFFEGNYLDVSFRARNEPELRKMLTSLESAGFVELFKVVQGER
jgi:ParB/RepB/Spo0J family partition protein